MNALKSQAIFYPGTLIKDKTKYFIENSNCSVGVFVNRGFTKISTTLILLENEADGFLIRYARRLLLNNADISVFIIDLNNVIQKKNILKFRTRNYNGIFKTGKVHKSITMRLSYPDSAFCL